jgi:hypothetical protein
MELRSQRNEKPRSAQNNHLAAPKSPPERNASSRSVRADWSRAIVVDLLCEPWSDHVEDHAMAHLCGGPCQNRALRAPQRLSNQSPGIRRPGLGPSNPTTQRDTHDSRRRDRERDREFVASPGRRCCQCRHQTALPTDLPMARPLTSGLNGCCWTADLGSRTLAAAILGRWGVSRAQHLWDDSRS